jgi:protein SCO1/2
MKWLFALCLVACHGHPVEHRTPSSPPPAQLPPRVTVEPADAPSIYGLQLQLRTAHGKTVGLDAGRGQITLVSMFYGSCPAACPALIDEVGRVLADSPVQDARVLLVSFDAEHDTPARLTELARDHHLDSHWTLASASDGDARALAAVLDLHYRKLADGSFAHDSVVVAVDADGRPIARMRGLGDHAALAAALRK